MLVKTFGKNGKNICKNIVKLNLKRKTHLYCIIIWSTVHNQESNRLLIVAVYSLEAIASHPQKGTIMFYTSGFSK